MQLTFCLKPNRLYPPPASSYFTVCSLQGKTSLWVESCQWKSAVEFTSFWLQAHSLGVGPYVGEPGPNYSSRESQILRLLGRKHSHVLILMQIIISFNCQNHQWIHGSSNDLTKLDMLPVSSRNWTFCIAVKLFKTASSPCVACSLTPHSHQSLQEEACMWSMSIRISWFCSHCLMWGSCPGSWPL